MATLPRTLLTEGLPLAQFCDIESSIHRQNCAVVGVMASDTNTARSVEDEVVSKLVANEFRTAILTCRSLMVGGGGVAAAVGSFWNFRQTATAATNGRFRAPTVGTTPAWSLQFEPK